MKYHKLKSYLSSRTESRFSMTFDEVAAAAAVSLPTSACLYPAWWANDASRHVQARAWLDAGYRSENVDLKARRLEFVRTGRPAQGMSKMQQTFDNKGEKVEVHPAYGALKGTFAIAPGWDLTKPAFDEDDLAEWDARLDTKADLIEAGMRRKK